MRYLPLSVLPMAGSSCTSTQFAVSTVSSSPSPRPSSVEGEATSYTGSALAAAVLNSTNTYRALFQARPVAWDQALALQATQDTQTCDFVHTNAGQNLAAGYASPDLAIEAWGDEYTKFDFTHPIFEESTGHFTQLVWQDTQKVGCGATQCPSDGSTTAQDWFLICNYLPVGNVVGQVGTNVADKLST